MEVIKGHDAEHLSTTASSTAIPSNTQHSHSTDNINAPSPSQSYAQSNNVPVSLPEKLSLFKRVWARLGMNSLVVMFMVKGALAPTIATAILQSHSVTQHYLNLGYLVIVISILSVPILPRGKFAMNMLASIVSFPSSNLVSFWPFFIQKTTNRFLDNLSLSLMKLGLTVCLDIDLFCMWHGCAWPMGWDKRLGLNFLCFRYVAFD